MNPNAREHANDKSLSSSTTGEDAKGSKAGKARHEWRLLLARFPQGGGRRGGDNHLSRPCSLSLARAGAAALLAYLSYLNEGLGLLAGHYLLFWRE